MVFLLQSFVRKSKEKASRNCVHVLNNIVQSKTLKCVFPGRIATFGRSPDGQSGTAILGQFWAPGLVWPRWLAARSTHSSYSKHFQARLQPISISKPQLKIRFGKNLTHKLNDIYPYNSNSEKNVERLRVSS